MILSSNITCESSISFSISLYGKTYLYDKTQFDSEIESQFIINPYCLTFNLICCKMKHDESKDLRSLSKIARIDIPNKHINIPVGTHIGIKRLGMLDYLTHYCGWTALKTNGPLVRQTSIVEFRSTNARKDSKQHNLTNKKK